jgi:hypothetical protein
VHVECGANSKAEELGDQHYRCCHRSWKVITLTKSMKCNLTSTFPLLAFVNWYKLTSLTSVMINNLKVCLPIIYQLFILLRDQRASGEKTTDEDIEIVSGKWVLDPRQTRAYLKGLESASDNISHAFKKQAEIAAVCLMSLPLILWLI